MVDPIPIKQPDPFEAFWRICPKKVGKPLAMAKFSQITSSAGYRTRTLDRDSGTYVEIVLQATAQELIDAMRAYGKSQIDLQTYDLKDGGRYTLHPATWLNQGRWMDG